MLQQTRQKASRARVGECSRCAGRRWRCWRSWRPRRRRGRCRHGSWRRAGVAGGASPFPRPNAARESSFPTTVASSETLGLPRPDPLCLLRSTGCADGASTSSKHDLYAHMPSRTTKVGEGSVSDEAIAVKALRVMERLARSAAEREASAHAPPDGDDERTERTESTDDDDDGSLGADGASDAASIPSAPYHFDPEAPTDALDHLPNGRGNQQDDGRARGRLRVRRGGRARQTRARVHARGHVSRWTFGHAAVTRGSRFGDALNPPGWSKRVEKLLRRRATKEKGFGRRVPARRARRRRVGDVARSGR